MLKSTKNWELHKTIYRSIADYAVDGFKQRTGMALTEKEEAEVVDLINKRLVVEEFAWLFFCGYLATRPLKLAFRIGKAIARKG